METFTKDLRRIEVEDIDDEVYYREMQGCKARLEGAGESATIDCGKDEFRIVQKAGVEPRTDSEPCYDCDAC